MTMALQTGFSTTFASRPASAPRFGVKWNWNNLRSGQLPWSDSSGDAVTTTTRPSAAKETSISGGNDDTDGVVTGIYKAAKARAADYHKTLTDKILAKVPQGYEGRKALEAQLNAFGEEVQEVLASIKKLVDDFKQVIEDAWKGIMWHPPKADQSASDGATGTNGPSDDASTSGIVTA